MHIDASNNDQTIGLGGTAKDMHLEGLELQRVSCTGLTIGSGTNSHITVHGVTGGPSPVGHSTFLGTVTLVATRDNAQIYFATTASTFNSLVAQADNGVAVGVKVTTKVGVIHLDGDLENSSSADSPNQIVITGAMTLQSATSLTLKAQASKIVASGAATLEATTGIFIQDTFDGTDAANNDITINADFDSTGVGTLTLQTGKTLTSNNNIVYITAYDVDLDGKITTGTKMTVIQGSQDDQTIGLGAAPSPVNMHVEADELERITATGFILGGTVNRDLTVNDLTLSSGSPPPYYTGYITGTVTLVALDDNAKVTFTGASSTFVSLAAQADNGVQVQAKTTTTTNTNTSGLGARCR
jgi:hypothetical protein